MKGHGWKLGWQILLFPVGLITAPMLLLGLIIAGHVLSALTGPVNFFNTTKHPPPPEQLAGFYRIANQTNEELEGRGIFVSQESGMRLELDHKLELIDFPAFDEWGKSRDCHYNGTGKWGLYETGTDIQLDITMAQSIPGLKSGIPSCQAENFALISLLGHSAPFHFWYVIGDPDSGEGLTYKRQ